MESLFGLIIFGIIAAVSGLVKLAEKRKEEELRKQRPTKQNVDELPEATRRMLYGDGGPPVARRRGAGPPPPPIAVPRRETLPQAPQRRPVPQRQVNIPTAVPQHRETTQQQPVPQPRQRPVPPLPGRMPAQAPARQSAQRTLQENWQRAQRPPESQQQRTPQPAAAEERARRASPARQRGSRASIKDLLHHPKTLRTSIILQEVLSPPKALR